jgi:hypothetical protein
MAARPAGMDGAWDFSFMVYSLRAVAVLFWGVALFITFARIV